MIRRFNFGTPTYPHIIISGDVMRETIEVFPELKDSFKQRRSFDEYYFTETEVFVDIERIEQLNDKWCNVTITPYEIYIEG
jgi:hypothetical protein